MKIPKPSELKQKARVFDFDFFLSNNTHATLTLQFKAILSYPTTSCYQSFGKKLNLRLLIFRFHPLIKFSQTNMDENTLRILITSITSSIAVITTALFGFFTHVRKDKISNLEKKLAWTLRQYKSLYRVEKLYLIELEKLLSKPASEIKKEFRKIVSDDGNDHLELTDTEVKKRLQRL